MKSKTIQIFMFLTSLCLMTISFYGCGFYRGWFYVSASFISVLMFFASLILVINKTKP